MTTIGHNAKDRQRLPEVFRDIFPMELTEAVEREMRRGVAVDEIRVRTGRQVWLTSGSRNIPLSVTVSRAEVNDMVDLLCDGSLYAHADTVNRGYITVNGAVRVGIVGRASVEGDRIIGIWDVSSLCFRLPRKIYRVGAPVCRLLRAFGGECGVLVYSPPGEGKTTLLRSVCRMMSSGEDPWRIAVVDTRGELGLCLDGGALSADVLTGYPRSAGIEIATRTMNAQLVVCDEIGDTGEARAILGAQNCGVPLLASAHASDVGMLLRRQGLSELHRSRVFGAYVGIRRREGKSDYEYTVTSWEDANEYVKNSGGGACGA